MASSGSTNSIEQLIGTPTGGPSHSVSPNTISRLRVSANIVRQNFNALDEFVDGDLQQEPLFVVYNPNKSEAVSYLFGHLHNYSSALYSFNEHVKEKVNENVSSHELTNPDLSSGKSRYTEKLAFIRGLRHEIQHGEYSCLDINIHTKAGDFEIYNVEFNKAAFMNSTVRSPRDYLRHTKTQDRQYPLSYIADFHQNHFNDFVDDTIDWMQGNP